MAGRREDRHVDADLGDDRLRRSLPDVGDRVEAVTRLGERAHHPAHFRVESGDGQLKVLQVVEGETDEQGVVLREASPEGFPQLGDLLLEPAHGKLGKRLRVALARTERPQHRPSRDAQDVGRHRVELDAGVLERLLDPLALRGVRLGESLAIAREIPQFADRSRGDEAAAQETVL